MLIEVQSFHIGSNARGRVENKIHERMVPSESVSEKGLIYFAFDVQCVFGGSIK